MSKCFLPRAKVLPSIEGKKKRQHCNYYTAFYKFLDFINSFDSTLSFRRKKKLLSSFREDLMPKGRKVFQIMTLEDIIK